MKIGFSQVNDINIASRPVNMQNFKNGGFLPCVECNATRNNNQTLMPIILSLRCFGRCSKAFPPPTNSER